MDESLGPSGTTTMSSLGENTVALAVGIIMSAIALLFAIPLGASIAQGEAFKTADLILFAILFLLPAIPGFVCLGIGLAFRRAEIDFRGRRIRLQTVRWFGLSRSLREIDLKDVKFVEISARAGHGRTGQILAVRAVLAVQLRDEPVRKKARVPLTGETVIRSGSAALEKMLSVARNLARVSGTRLMGPNLLAVPDIDLRLSALKMKDLAPTVLEGPADETPPSCG